MTVRIAAKLHPLRYNLGIVLLNEKEYNNANRFRYWRRKVRNHNGFGLFLYKFS